MTSRTQRTLIRASAGTGKTFRLSGHFLTQLFNGHAPESILATTFTRKAAGEILGRVLLRLADAADNDATANELGRQLKLPSGKVTQKTAQALLERLASELHRVRVCTLDSFFQQLARCLSPELGLPPGWTIIDEATDQDLRAQAIDAVLAQHAGNEAVQLMLMLARGRYKRGIRSLIDETVKDWHDLYLEADAAAWDVFPEQRPLADGPRQQAFDALESAGPLADSQFEKARKADLERFRREDWEGFVTTGVAAKIAAGQDVFSRKQIPAELSDLYQPLVGHARAEVLRGYALRLKGIRNLVERFDSEHARLRNEHGFLRFQDVTRLLARSGAAADDDRRLTFRMDHSIRNLLLDEFQDTSGDQWRVVRRLAGLLDEHDHSSLFCVGDLKQAIYGWRGGDARILDAVESSFEGVKAEPLDESRRSSPAVIETVNEVFQQVPSHGNLGDLQAFAEAWSDRFPNHSTARKNLPGYACLETGPPPEARIRPDGVVDTSVDPQDGGGMNGGAEGDLDGAAADSGDGDPGRGGRGPKVNPDWCLWVAGRIRDLYQQCPSAGIGVLTRTNDSVARIVHELTRLGVPASEEGGTAPTDSAAVLALISVLQMAAHPGCTASRFHVSQSPLGPVLGLTDWRSDSLASRVAAQVRAQLLDDGYGPALQAWSDAVSPAFGARDRLRWQQVIAAAWEFDAQGSLNPAGFARRLRLSAFAKSTPAPVRVMTIHQSKGLEFPVVVLPELHSELSRAPQQAWGQPGPGEPPDRVCVWVNEKLRPLLPKRIREIFEQTQERNLAESLSVLYVALTRAQHSVHLLVPPTTASKPPKTFAGLLTVALTGNGQSVPLRTLYERGDREWFRRVPELQSRARSGGDAALPAQGEPAPVCRQVRLASMPDGRRRGLVRRTPSRHDESQLFLPGTGNAVAERRSRNSRGATPKPRTRTAGSTKPATSVATGFPIEPREKGLLWHAWFECLEWVPAKGAAASVIDVAALRARAAKLAMSEPVIEQALPEFLSGLDQPAVRSVFNEAVCGASEGLIRSRSATGVLEVSRERPFALLSDNEVVTGTMDRLVLLLDRGQPVAADIVDFKTDRVVGDPDAWLADRAKFYQPQLGEYRTAVATMFKLPPACISARLVFTEASRVVDVK